MITDEEARYLNLFGIEVDDDSITICGAMVFINQIASLKLCTSGSKPNKVLMYVILLIVSSVSWWLLQYSLLISLFVVPGLVFGIAIEGHKEFQKKIMHHVVITTSAGELESAESDNLEQMKKVLNILKEQIRQSKMNM